MYRVDGSATVFLEHLEFSLLRSRQLPNQKSFRFEALTTYPMSFYENWTGYSRSI